MKKFQTLEPEGNKNENHDQTRRLYKAIFDGVHYLDAEQVYVKSCCDLFSRALVTQRMKLREHCERLMFLDATGYGRKAEELLWRKGYYETFAFAKRIRIGSSWNLSEKAYLQAHLLSGVGHYHNIILRLQAEFNIDLRGTVDFPLLMGDEGLQKKSSISSRANGKNSSESSPNARKKAVNEWSSALDWANQAVHRCLLYLGDLSRYLVDIYPEWDAGLAARYYYQALTLRPEAGMPHNQLGTLSGSKNYNLDAVYHYMRCICALETFEGTEGNLASVMERNARALESDKSAGDQPLVRRCISQFLYVTGILFFDRLPPNEDMASLVNSLLVLLQQCIAEEKPKCVMKEPETLDDATFSEDKNPNHLEDELTFKMFVISLMCIQRAAEKGVDKTGAEALCLSLTSVLVQACVNKFPQDLPPPRPSKAVRNDEKSHSRRRRRRLINSSLSSEESDTEKIDILNSDTSDSEEELVFDAQSPSQSDDEDEEKKVNGFSLSNGDSLSGDKKSSDHGGNEQTNGSAVNGVAKNLKALHISSVPENKTFTFVKEMSENGFLLQTVKICCDWLRCNLHILSTCIESSRPLVLDLVLLFNYLLQIPQEDLGPHAHENWFNDETSQGKELKVAPLSEDIELRNLSILNPAHSSIDWNHHKTKMMDTDSQALTRVSQLLQFGQQLSEMDDVGVDFYEDRKWFCVKNLKIKSTLESPKKHIQEDGVLRGKLMQNLGKAWLKAEVRSLESKTERSTLLPPYLIVDCDAFINYCPLVKQLVNSKKFIVLIPSVVVQMLDELKRTSGKVRDTIRWLEAQLKNGNRFLQAQHSHQCESIPFIKYPKKKNKEAWIFFQVLECCYYLSKQNTKDASNLITLVTGSNLNNCNYNPVSAAKSAGVNVEHIEAFHGKWKNSCKSHG